MYIHTMLHSLCIMIMLKCIDPWLMEKGSCPQCKVDVLKQLGLRDADVIAEVLNETEVHTAHGNYTACTHTRFTTLV